MGAFSTLGYGNSGVYNDVGYFVPEKAPMTEAEREQAAESARNNLLNNILGGIGYVAGRVGDFAKGIWDKLFGDSNNDPNSNQSSGSIQALLQNLGSIDLKTLIDNLSRNKFGMEAPNGFPLGGNLLAAFKNLFSSNERSDSSTSNTNGNTPNSEGPSDRTVLSSDDLKPGGEVDKLISEKVNFGKVGNETDTEQRNRIVSELRKVSESLAFDSQEAFNQYFGGEDRYSHGD
ncbi:hypothetical protein LEP1GSC047_3427 [Leptospira inadai serovar Lyme str. 10]|uniref:Uncharacterized protein n=1 Tax=Leptospira inadai serovar Lyme str. 10 TaxID=1049790 RepID=V6H7U6_9LEPT|nr:hypothetical protein [Leptospira inadai]EQA34682.1 hypothetical protein LEP1GSC047_3427 [Leptospira inadai serovar Lyme str. 10]